MCEATTKKGTKCKNKTKNKYCKIHSKLQGDGLISSIKNTYNDLKYRYNSIKNPSPRENVPTGRFNEYLEKNKDKKIKSIKVGRKPIVPIIKKALDILSFGKFSKKQKELQYEDVFHQYTIIEYENGEKVKIEKNQTVMTNPVNTEDEKDILINIDTRDKNLNVKDLMNNASKNDKDKNFWKYDAKNSNCQGMVADIVRNNNLIPDVDTSKILKTQDARSLVETIPEPLRGIPLLITNLGSAADKVIFGNGLKGNKKNDILKMNMILDGLI